MIEELKNLVVDLISYKTQGQNFNSISQCMNYIRKYFADSDYICELSESNKVKSLFIHKKDVFDFDCLFDGHIDVVPARDDQFEAFIKDQKLFGRGAIDMKSQVATFLYFIKHYNGNKKLGAIVTSDEEIGGFNGTPMVIDKFKISSKVAIVPDGGYNYQLINSERGVLQLNIDIKGESVHSSREPEGKNALCRAMNLYKRIKKYLNKTSKDCQTVNLARLTTVNDVYNKVPDDANMLIDIRYNIKSNIAEVYRILERCSYAKFFVYAKANPFYVDENDLIIRNYIAICEEVLGEKIEIKECYAASDARFFTERNIPAIIMNPAGQGMHEINECINIESFDVMLKIYEKFMEVL